MSIADLLTAVCSRRCRFESLPALVLFVLLKMLGSTTARVSISSDSSVSSGIAGLYLCVLKLTESPSYLLLSSESLLARRGLRVSCSIMILSESESESESEVASYTLYVYTSQFKISTLLTCLTLPLPSIGLTAYTLLLLFLSRTSYGIELHISPILLRPVCLLLNNTRVPGSGFQSLVFLFACFDLSLAFCSSLFCAHWCVCCILSACNFAQLSMSA